mgnify:CR=1 FL=1
MLAYFQKRYKLKGIVLEGLVHDVNNLLIIFIFTAGSSWDFVFGRFFLKKFEKTLFRYLTFWRDVSPKNVFHVFLSSNSYLPQVPAVKIGK